MNINFSINGNRFSLTTLLIGLLAVAVVVGASVGLYFGIRAYRERQDRNANLVLAQAIDAFNVATTSQKPEEWDSVIARLDEGYQQNKHRAIAPYFLSFKAQAQLKKGDKEQAQKTMEDMLGSMSRDSLMYPIFSVTHALIMLDSSDDQVVNQGIDLLTQSAQDRSNEFRDLAQYYLGQYYLAQGDIDKARTAWNDLIDTQWTDTQAPSPWLRLVQDTLGQLS